jgi:tRNA 2-(methylsulfanyl)-N6-isopentenyladenosine37 hydroxylase
MFQLQSATPDVWLERVFGDFDAFLIDHTSCERKASAMGLSLVSKYPDKTEILDPLIAFAREELEHFHTMVKVLLERGLRLYSDERDIYVNELRRHLRSESSALFLDRLLVAGVIEARSCERLEKLTRALPEGPLQRIYLELTRAEARHHALFFRLAERYFAGETVRARARELFSAEAEIINRMPLRAAVH